MQKNIRIEVKTQVPYDVLVGDGLLDSCGKELAAIHKPCRVVLVADSTVDSLYGAQAAAGLEAGGFHVQRYSFPQGETSKSLAQLGALLEFLAENRFTRTDLVVALGGGVTGDLAGFAASVYLRGVDLVQLPTTLLAAVDSSVGGKTAVNLSAGKNLCGTFHQPILVLCDTSTFRTLPEETFSDGMAESIKYGLLCDKELFDSFATEAVSQENLQKMVARCIAIKARLVAEDEHDNGLRQLLNLGHTLGHAMEKLSHFQLSHGHAVAIGMALISRIAQQQGWCPPGVHEAVCQVLARRHLPTQTAYSSEELTQAALSDKKRRGDSITLVAPREVGDCVLRQVPVEQLQGLIASGLECV